MAALLVKVGSVLLKQLAKPLSSQFQAYIMSHPVSRNHAINASQVSNMSPVNAWLALTMPSTPPSQTLHQIEVWLTRSADGKTGKAFIGKMSEEKSIELASKFVSEGFVFAVGVAIVAFEYVRQGRKETAKKLQEREEKDRLRGKEEDERNAFRSKVDGQIESLNENLDQLSSRLKLLQDQLYDHIEQAINEEKKRQAAQKRKGWFGFSGSHNKLKQPVKIVPGRTDP